MKTLLAALGLAICIHVNANAAGAWPTCGEEVDPAKYQKVDLNQYVLMVTSENACRHVEIVERMAIPDGAAYGVMSRAGYMGRFSGRSPSTARVEFTELTDDQIEYLRTHCPDYAPCISRWRVTLLRHEDDHEVIRLDGWRP